MNSTALMELTDTYIMTTYGRYPIALVEGKGAKVWDADGKEYLDFLGGLAVNILGHSHEAVATAIADQARKLIHCSNLYYSPPGALLAELLVKSGGLDRVFFCNSGAEANEGAFKLARKYHYRLGATHKTKIVSTTHSFHGRTLAALTATHKPQIQEGFGPLPSGFAYAEFGDIESLRAAVDAETAAVILEPVQGEGGIHPLSSAYLRQAREICDSADALLIFDEIQCGLGRTGSLFAYQGLGVTPDIITLAKGLGGGLPIGAICATQQVASQFQPGDHATTFGANPVACAAALATMKELLNTDLIARVARAGAYLLERLNRLKAKYPGHIREVRGVGLMLGIELAMPGGSVLEKCHEMGLLANVTAGTVLRLLPPYVVTMEEIDRAVDIIDQVIGTMR